MENYKNSKISQYPLDKIIRLLSSILTKYDNIYTTIEKSYIPFLEACNIIKVMESEKIISVNNEKIEITDKGKKIVEELRVTELIDNKCPLCKGKGLNIEKYKNFMIKFEEITKNRPKPVQNFDQGYVTPITNFLRISLAESYGNIKNKKILILGDDDLLSIALGLTSLPYEITVFEIDKRIVNYIKDISKEYKLNINPIEFDLREKVPDYYESYFDTFFSDPPETIDAFKSFIGKGIFALKKYGGAGYFGITLVDASLNKWNNFQKIISNDFNVVITDIIRDFNEYENWDYHENTPAYKALIIKKQPDRIWYKSTIYRIETIGSSTGYNEKLDTNILQDEENATS
ncbi:MAG TPA: bis-aminopropyl spermidine synthase family protein [Spirochaetota bacterium]|nr:bis-aminopropyl spermidine synthase family protein [Spirochaetota bacterium]HOM37768.1 bis-aminopropyl spermidine synthase family protein [Spirochaetota bacterium]HPQ49355.1 bis-aminopropyl spermidine synthase family protein [Spirochaetota bacterium]